MTLEHKRSLKSLGYICSNSHKYTVWVKLIDLNCMPKIISILKGSYDAISSFAFSLEGYKLIIDEIPEVTKTKVSKPKRYSLSKLRL